MATLTDTADVSRKAIRYGVIAIIVFLILRLLFAVFSWWWGQTHEPPPPPTNEIFGVLPRLPFSQENQPQLELLLQTTSGTTGEFDVQKEVFFMPSQRAGLLSLDRTSELAKRMGFIREPRKLSETLYKWVKNDPIQTSVEIDTVTNHFRYRVDWRNRPDLLINTRAQSKLEAINRVRNWIKRLNILQEDLASGEAKAEYLKISGLDLIPAESQSEAQFVRVNFYRSFNKELLDKKDEKVPVLPLDPNHGIVSVLILANQYSQIDIIEADYNYFDVDYSQAQATYLIISSQEAFQRLQDGRGYYASPP